MKIVLRTMILGLVFALPVSAEELVATIDPTQAAGSESVRFADGALHVEAAPGQPQQVLIHLSDPRVTMPVYAVTGMVRYDVEGIGYLQLDSRFGGQNTYFTKGMAHDGPLAAISGSSDWRPFMLPFYTISGDDSGFVATPPQALTLSLYLPGAGQVELRDISLYQYAAGEDPLGGGTSFVGMSTTALIGAIGGALVGLWGAMVGVLVPRGKARGFVMATTNLLIIVGVLVIFGGLYAIGSDQPYDVWYPLLMFGGILVFVVGGLRFLLPGRYEAVELKKMQAMDA